MPKLELGAPADVGAIGALRRLDAFARIHPLGGARLLDLGCGNGMYTQHLSSFFSRVDAVDVEPERLKDFEGRLSEEERSRIAIHLTEPGEALPVLAGSVDAVTCIEVLEHVEDVPALLSEVARILDVGGVFYVTVPNRAFPIETHSVTIFGRRLAGRWIPFLPWLPPLHRVVSEARSYTVRTLRKELRDAGFEPIGTDWIMPPFDRWKRGNRYLKPITDRLERTVFRRFGVSIVMAARRIQPT